MATAGGYDAVLLSLFHETLVVNTKRMRVLRQFCSRVSIRESLDLWKKHTTSLIWLLIIVATETVVA